MSKSSNFNSNDRFENIIKALTEQLLTKEDLKGIHYKLNQVIEAFRHNLSNPEVRAGMKSFGNPNPDTRFFQPPTNPGVNPFNQRGNQMPGFFKSSNPCGEMFSNPQTNNGVSSNEDRNHSPSGVVKTPTGHTVVIKPPLLQPGEQYIKYEIDLLQINPRVTHHVSTPNGGFVLYYTASDGTVLHREVHTPMSQQPTMPNSVKSNSFNGAFSGPQLTPDQVKINVLEKRIEALEKSLLRRVIPRLETLEEQSTKKVNVSEPKIEDEVDLYRDLAERLNNHQFIVNNTKTVDKGEVDLFGDFMDRLEAMSKLSKMFGKGEVKETVSKTDVKVAGNYGPSVLDRNVCYPPKMYLENKEEVDKIHEKLKDVETIEDVRQLDLMYLVLSSLYSCYHDFTSSNELLFKLRRGVAVLKLLEERGLHLTYPQVFNHIANHIANRK